MIIGSPKEKLAEFVSNYTGFNFSGGYSALGCILNEKLVCAVVFDCWRGGDIELSIAGDSFPRSFIKACGVYIFEELNCRRATLRTSSIHYKAIEGAFRLGAKFEGMQRDYYPSSDAILFGITKKDWTNGRQFSGSAASKP